MLHARAQVCIWRPCDSNLTSKLWNIAGDFYLLSLWDCYKSRQRQVRSDCAPVSPANCCHPWVWVATCCDCIESFISSSLFLFGTSASILHCTSLGFLRTKRSQWLLRPAGEVTGAQQLTDDIHLLLRGGALKTALATSPACWRHFQGPNI